MTSAHTKTKLWFCGRLVGGLLTTTACAARVGPITAQVLDARTNQPIAGAVVLGVWTTKGEGIFGAHASTKLVDVQEAERDSEGRFTIERPGVVDAEDESITVHTFGYVAWSNWYLFPSFARRPAAEIPLQIPLEVFPPDGNHREHMRFVGMGKTAGV